MSSRGRILPSMKKSTSYTAFITLRDGKILRAKCGCPAGIEGHCNHVCSMLFFLEEFCEHNAKNAACTSQPCSWSKPSRKRKVGNHPIHQVKFVKDMKEQLLQKCFQFNKIPHNLICLLLTSYTFYSKISLLPPFHS